MAGVRKDRATDSSPSPARPVGAGPVGDGRGDTSYRYRSTNFRPVGIPASIFRIYRLIRTLTVLSVVGVFGAIGISAILVAEKAKGQIYHDPSLIPAAPVAIVPGARVFPDGRPSLTLQNRLDAGRHLYESGVVDHLLVSGDNREANYNEPAAMRDALVAAGVPAEDVSIDYAGLDTWDTCQRAAEQFGVTKAVLVTQERYAKRSAALCKTAGIETAVLAIEAPVFQRRSTGFRRSSREVLAKVKAAVDMTIGTEATHGGPAIGLVGSVGMPPGGHPPDWDWTRNAPAE